MTANRLEPVIPELRYGEQEGFRAELVSKIPHLSFVVVLYYPIGLPPYELFQRLMAAGWRQDGEPFLQDGERVIIFKKAGTGLFGSWNEKENRSYNAQARMILRRYGYNDVPRTRVARSELV